MDYYINWGLCNLPTFKLPATDSPTEHGKPTNASRLFAWLRSYAIPTANLPLQLPFPTTILQTHYN